MEAQATPFGDGHGFDEAALDGGIGLKLVFEAGENFAEHFDGFTVEDNGTGEKAVTEGIAGGAAFAFGSAGSGGMSCVGDGAEFAFGSDGAARFGAIGAAGGDAAGAGHGVPSERAQAALRGDGPGWAAWRVFEWGYYDRKFGGMFRNLLKYVV
jgi:hypothetical protein